MSISSYRRLARLLFFRRRWDLPCLVRKSLPLPPFVRRNLFEVDLCVFIFGTPTPLCLFGRLIAAAHTRQARWWGALTPPHTKSGPNVRPHTRAWARIRSASRVRLACSAENENSEERALLVYRLMADFLNAQAQTDWLQIRSSERLPADPTPKRIS
jgi:hypothetical protein